MIINGENRAIIRSQPFSYSPSTGRAAGTVYEGTYDVLENFARGLSPDTPHRLDDSDAPLCRLYVEEPGTDTAVTFELASANLQKSIWEHPRFLTLSREEAKKIKDAVADSLEDAPSGLTDLGVEFFWIGRLGTTDFAIDRYRFKMTTVATSRAKTDVSFSNINSIYSTDQLVKEAKPPDSILFALADISSFGSEAIVPTNYAYGWLKGTPTVTQIAYNRFAIAVEFQEEVLSTILYQISDAEGEPVIIGA
jgi:hypothetical protein